MGKKIYLKSLNYNFKFWMKKSKFIKKSIKKNLCLNTLSLVSFIKSKRQAVILIKLTLIMIKNKKIILRVKRTKLFHSKYFNKNYYEKFT